MARFDREGTGPTYAVAQRFVDACLRVDGSLFTPGAAIWTLEHFEELDRNYVQATDPGTGTFFEKLHVQIGGSSQGAIQLAAELIYVLYLPASVHNIGGDKKREHVRQLLSWISAPPTIPDDLASALDHGIGGGGTGFNTYRWAHFSYLVRLGLAWKRLTPSERDSALADPWSFHAAAGVVGVESGTFAHEALLHLVHPDTFERIFSRGDKWNLTSRLAGLVGTDDPDVDRRIAQIRGRLEPRLGAGFDFYETVGASALWRPEDDRWRVFLYWCRRFREDPSFDEAERDYKLELAQLLTASRRALLDGQDDWLELLGRALKSRHNNLTDWRQHDTFLKWAAAEEETARAALSALWREGADPVEALAAFLGEVPRTAISTPGNRASIGSVLLMAVDATRCPPYRPTPLQRAYALTGSDDEETDEVARYRRALGFFDTVLKRGSEVGLELRDRLDAQAVTWWITSSAEPSSEWAEEDKDALARFRGDTEEPPGADPVLTDEDFAVLARHHDSKSWSAIPAGDQAALRGLRGRLGELATLLADRLGGRVALQAFTSNLNPSGRAPKFYWVCAYPKDARNKSYAYQLFVIVHPDWVELGFGSGSGDSQLQDTALENELRSEMTLARASLAAVKGAPWTAELERHVRELGYAFRHRWLAPEDEPLPGISAWLDASGEPGAAVSQFLSPEEVVSLGPGLADRVLGLLEPLVPLLEAAHADQPTDQPLPAGEPASIEQLAKTLYLDVDYLRDVEWLLRDKRQLVFYGPPGTGKTFVAEAFAEWFAGDPSRVETVQFHPSYAYEDFIEGIRPALDADQVRYTLGEGGLLKRFANRAAKDPDHRPHVLVIDEINRANLARVFGELLYLLEYRDRAVMLPYSNERFRLPDNLYLIGTMNTADRSIALVDFALRRRFHFIRFDPDVAVLRRWLADHAVSTEPADLLAWVNHEIGDGDFAIGFSYFMRDDLDETILRRVWERSILPALEEFYFEDVEKRARFGLDRVRAAVQGEPMAIGDGQGSAEEPAAEAIDDEVASS